MSFIWIVERDHSLLKLVAHVPVEQLSGSQSSPAGDYWVPRSSAYLQCGLTRDTDLRTGGVQVFLRLHSDRELDGVGESGLGERVSGAELVAELRQVKVRSEG